MAWINIKWTDEKVQNTIGKWRDGHVLEREDWMTFSDVYGLTLASYTVPLRAEFRDKAIHIPVEDNILQLCDSSLFDSQKLKFKLSDRFVTIIEKQGDVYRVTSSDEQATEITLYLTDVGINITNYHSYRWGEQSKSLLGNAFLGDSESIESSDSNAISSKDGFVTHKGYRTLGVPVCGLGANIPYKTHQSFDSSNNGYQYFDFINKNDKITYIGYFSDVQDFSSGILNSSNSSFTDANGNIHYGPFLIFEYHNQYIPQNGNVQWNWNSSENKWFITDTEGVAQPILLKNLNHSGSWYITDSTNKKTKIQDEEVIQYLTSNYFYWQELPVRIYPTNPDFVMGFTMKVEMPDFIENKVDTVIPSPFEMLTTVESNTSEYDLMQIAQNLSRNTKKYYKTQWQTGKYTTSGYIKMWEQYTPHGWVDSSFNVTNPDQTTELHIQLAKLFWRIKFSDYLPDDYMYQYPEHGYEWYAFYNDANYHVSYFDSGVPLAYDWLMTDFSKVNYLLNTTDHFFNTITLNTQDSPDIEPQTLSNSLSSVHIETSSGSNKRYGFFTLFTDEAPETISLVFAVKNLAGGDFSDSNAAN